MNIYIAGKFTAWERLRGHRDNLRSLGHQVSSEWMNNGEASNGTSLSPQSGVNMVEALRDIREVKLCETLIIDTIDESNTGGREVELGMAMEAEKQIIVIGPRRNVFHFIAHHHFDIWEDFYAWLK